MDCFTGAGEDTCGCSQLQPSSALKFFLVSLPRLIPDQHICFTLLLRLLPPVSAEVGAWLAPATESNPLFDPDPANDYAEDVVVMEGVVEALRCVVAELVKTREISLLHCEGVVSIQAPSWSDQFDCGVQCDEAALSWGPQWQGSDSCSSWWEGAGVLLGVKRVQLLQPLLVTISEALGHSSVEEVTRKLLVL